MNDIFEIVIPYLTSSKKKTMLTIRVYTDKQEWVDLFIKQHNIKVYDVNILEPESFGRDFPDTEMLDRFVFESNVDGQQYTIITSEELLDKAIDYVGSQFSGVCVFGDAIFRTDIPIIDIINRLIEKVKHANILDYFMLEGLPDDDIRERYKAFSVKVFDTLPNSPCEDDLVDDYIYESLHANSYLHGKGPEAITVEGYVEYMAMLLSDSVD
jgi:hypothetical protein